MMAIALITRTNLGCEVKTETDDLNPSMVHIELSVPVALSLEPDPVKDKGINWETGEYKLLRSKRK